MADQSSFFEGLVKSGLDGYRDWREENPELHTALSILPVTGQLAAVADYADAMDRGDTMGGIAAAASFIPGVKLAKFGGRIAPAVHDLAAAKMFAPGSLRARMAPATEAADKIGKVAAGEQLVEYSAERKSWGW